MDATGMSLAVKILLQHAATTPSFDGNAPRLAA
jgi:hypothetical protein